MFNIQEKITVHFQTRVYIHTGKHSENIYNILTVLVPPPHQLEGLSAPPAGSGAEPRDQQIF